MTWVALAVSLLAGSLLAALAWPLARRLSPPTATVVLTGAALSTAAGTGFIGCVLGFQALAGEPLVATLGGWDVTSIEASLPGPDAAAVVGAVVLVLLARTVLVTVRQGQDLLDSTRTCRTVPDSAGLVITADGQAPEALAGFPGRIVVGAPVLAALTPGSRRAVLAHEAAHLAHRHHAYLQLVEIAIAANPLLRPVRGATRYATERWADESAARQVGDRGAVAAAIATVATLTPPVGRRVRTTALAAAADVTTARVRALLSPATRSRRGALAAAVLVILAPATAAVAVEHRTETVFEQAQHLLIDRDKRPGLPVTPLTARAGVPRSQAWV